MHSQDTTEHNESDTQRQSALFPKGFQFPIFPKYSMTQL